MAEQPGRWAVVRARAIHTFEGAPVEAMLLHGGRVIATGAEDELIEGFGHATRIRLDGVLYPGFHDAHCHPSMVADNELHADCSPENVANESALARCLAAEAAATPPGGWVIGTRYDHAKSTAGRVIDRQFLDRVVPDQPALLVHVAAHWGVLNSAALDAAGLDEGSTDPSGGALGRDARGRLNGVVYEQALFDIAYPALARGQAVIPVASIDRRLDGLRRTLAKFHAAGLTSCCDALCGPDDVRLLRTARAAGALSMRVSMLLAYPHYPLLAGLGLGGGFGDDWLRLLGVKAFVDGACAGGNCLVSEPFVGTDDHGMQVTSAEDLDELARATTADGVVLGVHANGDAAIRLLLDAHEKAAPVGALRPRHRIEHCTLVDDEIVRRIKALRLVAVPFGSYARFHADKLGGYYGAERLERMFAHRTLLDADIPVAGSSDYPCGPIDVLAAIASCVQRRGTDGTPVGLSQRITATQAIAAYTTGSAYACGEEDSKGRLAPGMLADFVELSDDPCAVAPDEIAGLQVRSTWVGGRCVHRA